MNIENEEDKKNSKVPIPTRWLIVHYKTMGMTGEQVSQKVSVSASNCNRIYNKYLTTGDVVDLNRTGRPPEIPEKDKKMFIEGAKVHPELNINTLIEETKVDFCKMTGSRLLKGAGYQCKTARVKWFIPPDDRELRLNWARKYIKMPNEFWRRVIFTDECRVQFNTKKEKLWFPKDVCT